MATDPWAEFSPQSVSPAPAPNPASPPPFIPGSISPSKQVEMIRAEEDQQMQRDAAARAARNEQYQRDRDAKQDVRQEKKDAQGTEGEKKIATLLTRIAGGFNDIQSNSKNDPSAQAPGLVETIRGDLMPGGVGGWAARRIAGENRRSVHDAQRDILDALLTLGTGAAYNAEQLSGQMASYFPQYGDSDKEAAIKNQRLSRLIEAAKANAGPAWEGVEPAIAPYMQGLNGNDPASTEQVGDGQDDDLNVGLRIRPEGGDNVTWDYGPSPTPESQAYDAEVAAIANDKRLYGDPNGLSGLTALGKQGITLGLSDEASGLGGAISSLLTGNDPIRGYRTSRDAERIAIDRARNAWPVLGFGAELAGGGGAMRVAGAGGNALLQGAGIGSLGGFGYGEGAQGSAMNALMGGTLGAGLGAITNRLSRPPSGGPDMGVVQAGQRQGIPIRQPDARPELRGRMAQAETTQHGGPAIREARAADQAAVEGRISEIGGQGRTSDPYALGSRVQEAGKRYIARTRQQADALYKRATSVSQGKPVTPTEAIAALDQNIAELSAAGANSNSGQIAYLKGLREDFAKPGGMTVDAVRNLRTNMRGQLSERNLTGTDADRRVRQVIDAANSDLVRELPQEASTALRAADKFYSERQSFINDTLKEFMGSRGNPLPAETAATRLISMAQGKGNFERFSSMWRELAPTERSDVAATIAASLGRRTNGEFSLSTLGRSLDPSKGINPRTVRLVFGKEGAEALNDLRVIAQAKTDTATALNNSRTGVMVNQAAGGLKTLIMGALGFAGGGPGGAAAGAVSRELFSRWGEQRAARMLLNPDFTKWLRNMPNTSHPKAIEKYFGKLTGILTIAANDSAEFVNAVRAAYSASPSSVAAATDQENN